MNYGYNYSQYGQYPYQQPQLNQYIPLTFVSGVEGAKAYIVAPNQTVYLRDSDTDVLYIKTADIQGKYTLKAYNLVPIENNQKAVNVEFASIEALNALKNDFEQKMNKISLELEKLNGGKNNE